MKTRYEVTTIVDAEGRVVSSRVHQGSDKATALQEADKGLELMKSNSMRGLVQVVEITGITRNVITETGTETRTEEVSSIIYEKKN